MRNEAFSHGSPRTNPVYRCGDSVRRETLRILCEGGMLAASQSAKQFELPTPHVDDPVGRAIDRLFS